MTDFLDWKNLKENLCPKCGKDFMDGLIPNPFVLEHKCGFKIRERRYSEIVSSMVNEQIDQKFDPLS